MPNLKLWTYEEVDVRDDVKLDLTGLQWKLRIFKVIAGEEEGKKYSGKPWYVQVLSPTDLNKASDLDIFLCDCPEGKFRGPLSVIGYDQTPCKHSENLLAFLKEKGGKR